MRRQAVHRLFMGVAVVAALCAALPAYVFALWQETALLMSVFIGIGIFMYQASHAPGLAVVQSAVHPNTRALAASFVFLFSNLLGLGLGPLAVGGASDYFAEAYGNDSLRVALSLAMLVLLPAIFWYWRSATAMDDTP